MHCFRYRVSHLFVLQVAGGSYFINVCHCSVVIDLQLPLSFAFSLYFTLSKMKNRRELCMIKAERRTTCTTAGFVVTAFKKHVIYTIEIIIRSCNNTIYVHYRLFCYYHYSLPKIIIDNGITSCTNVL